jgi:tRNA(Ile)-lysidine synthase TilS/MesJ
MFEKNNNFYKDLPDNILITKFNGLEIPFDKTWKRIGVNLSGGADSALLTYLLCKIIDIHDLDTQVDIITYQRCWETRPWQGYVAQQVYMWLMNKFPKTIHKRHLTYIPPELEHGVIGPIVDGRSGDQIIVGSYNKFAAWNYKLDAVFNATSKNPDDLREDRMKNRDKDAEDGNLIDLWRPSKGVECVFVHPFKFVKKDWIVTQYHLYNILDLYYTTRSCEGDINHHDNVREAVPSFKAYRDGMPVPECKQCWWCEERAWAESQVDNVIKEIDEL